MKHLFLISFIFWLLSTVSGYFAYKKSENFYKYKVKQPVKIDNLKKLQEIFLNNSKVYVYNIFGGFLLSIPTTYSLILNGYVIGKTIANCICFGISIKILSLCLLPHLSEIIAIFISTSISYYITIRIFSIIKTNLFFTSLEILELSRLTISGFVILFISAYLEAYVSFYFVEQYNNGSFN